MHTSLKRLVKSFVFEKEKHTCSQKFVNFLYLKMIDPQVTEKVS